MSLVAFKVTKDPDAVLDYGMDWSQWLNTGDTISSATWSVTAPTGDGDPIAVDSDSETTTVATAIVSGGTVGNQYDLTCRIVTAAGLTDDRTIRVTVVNR